MSIESRLSGERKFHINNFDAFFGYEQVATVKVVVGIVDLIEDVDDF